MQETDLERMISIIQPKKGSDLELKPCPFCGSENVVYIEYERDGSSRWEVMCLGCVASIDPGWARSKYALTPMWNKREGENTTS